MMLSGATDQASNGLGARLRDLRKRYATLNVLTEIVHLDDRMVAMRATVRIDGQITAHGHAAKAADQTGSFVAEAELLAVRQALLLAGFATDADLVPANSDAVARASPVVTVFPGATPPPRTSPNSAPAISPAKRQRSTATAQQPLTVAADLPHEASLHALPASAPAADSVAVANSESVLAPAPGAITPVDAVADATLAATIPDADRVPAPRQQRNRKARREREHAPATTAASLPGDTGSGAVPQSRAAHPAPETPSAAVVPASTGPDVAALSGEPPSVPVRASTVVPTPPSGASARQEPLAEQRNSTTALPGTGAPTPSRPTAPRRSRSVPASEAAATTPAPDIPPTQEQLRAAWGRGRPIPAWWPPERPLVTKRVTKAQAERLRAIALDEEITPALLDVYSTMLFDRTIADLDQTQYAILEERLDRAYPSPLEETRARRLIYPIAVGDAMPIPPDRPIFVRWRDVPPVAAVEETLKPAPPSWRMRGPRVSGRRR